jgi:hypothetical protein
MDGTMEHLTANYHKAGLIPLCCKGYHPIFNPERDYDIAKEPVKPGWNNPDYVSPTDEELVVWSKNKGWTGWRLPKGIIAIDVEVSEDIALINGICREKGIDPGIHETNNGVHFIFHTDRDLSGASKVFTKSGIKVTYRVGGKNYLILAPTNNRAWERWKDFDNLPTIPDDLLPYDRNNTLDVLNCFAHAVHKAYTEKQFSGYEDIDAALMAFLIDSKSSLQQVHHVFQIIFDTDYEERQTSVMYERTKSLMENGSPVLGAGTFMMKVKDEELKEIERFARELKNTSNNTLLPTDKTIPTKDIVETPFVKPSYFYERDDSYEPEYLVDPLILAKSIVLLAGSPGSMKSWLMQALLVALASQETFLGRLTKKVKFFYFDRENPEYLWHQRLVQYFKTKISDDLVYIWPYWMRPAPPKFLDPSYLALAKENPESVFVFDSYSKFLPKGYSENTNENAADVTNFLRELTAYGITVILIHHAGKDSSNGVRGAEEILAGVDVAFTLTKNDNRLTLKSIKNRFASDSTILIDVKTDIDGYISFEDASEDEQRKKEQKLTGHLKTVCEIVIELNAQTKPTTKEAVKDVLKKTLDIGDQKAREIIQQAISREHLLYDKAKKALSVCRRFVTPKGGVTTPTTDPHLDLLSDSQMTSAMGGNNLSAQNNNKNPVVTLPNRQHSITPTIQDDDDLVHEIEEDIPNAEGERCTF